MGPSLQEKPRAIEAEKDNHGALYWFARRVLGGVGRFYGRHWFAGTIFLVLFVGITFWLRPLYQPYVLGVRKFSFLVPLFAPIAFFLSWAVRKRSLHFKILIWAVIIALIGGAWKWESGAYHYCKLYLRYRDLPKTELTQLPLTDHERIQPLHSVYTQALENMTDVERPTRFDFVRIGDEYHFTAAIEPAKSIRQTVGSITELLSVPGTVPAANFAPESRIKVHFNEGETMYLSHNIFTSVRRAFSPSLFWSYEPSDVFRVQNDKGEWVQVVSLIHWTGILFPRPEFGGVYIVPQADSSPAEALRRTLWGSGTWVPPERLAEHPFLIGQNTVAFDISRFAAESFRFQYGFWAPAPGYHYNDIRIPELPGDQNAMPYTCFFRLSEAKGQDKLYQYFAMEPYDADKQGLTLSIFYPADGIGSVYYYRHNERGGVVSGVSAIAAKVMESKKQYDWTRHRPVEHLPYIKDMAGGRRFFWKTTVITMKDPIVDAKGNKDSTQFYIAGTVPEIVFTDTVTKMPTWVDSHHPETWAQDLETQMKDIWK